MKNRKTLSILTVLAVAFALAPGTEAARQPEGGPAHHSSTARNASSEAGAPSKMPDNILPIASISFAPVGLTFGQTARLNLVNMHVANGITVSCRFIDASGVTLSQSVMTLSLGKITSVAEIAVSQGAKLSHSTSDFTVTSSQQWFAPSVA